MQVTIDEILEAEVDSVSERKAQRRLKRFHARAPRAAERLCEIASSHVSAASFSADENTRDDQEDQICEAIIVSANAEDGQTYGLISSVIMGVIVKLIVDFIMSKFGA